MPIFIRSVYVSLEIEVKEALGAGRLKSKVILYLYKKINIFTTTSYYPDEDYQWNKVGQPPATRSADHISTLSLLYLYYKDKIIMGGL